MGIVAKAHVCTPNCDKRTKIHRDMRMAGKKPPPAPEPSPQPRPGRPHIDDPPTERPSQALSIEKLFAIMRKEHVLLFKGLGVEIQMAQDAAPDNIASELIKRAEEMNKEEPDIDPEKIDPAFAAPFMAFRKPSQRPDFIRPPEGDPLDL